MRSFNFRLEESLHQDLKALAQTEGASMAALCREALALYVERQKAELGMPQCPQVRHHQALGWGPQWSTAPQQARKRHRPPLPSGCYQRICALPILRVRLGLPS